MTPAHRLHNSVSPCVSASHRASQRLLALSCVSPCITRLPSDMHTSSMPASSIVVHIAHILHGQTSCIKNVKRDTPITAHQVLPILYCQTCTSEHILLAMYCQMCTAIHVLPTGCCQLFTAVNVLLTILPTICSHYVLPAMCSRAIFFWPLTAIYVPPTMYCQYCQRVPTSGDACCSPPSKRPHTLLEYW